MVIYNVNFVLYRCLYDIADVDRLDPQYFLIPLVAVIAVLMYPIAYGLWESK